MIPNSVSSINTEVQRVINLKESIFKNKKSIFIRIYIWEFYKKKCVCVCEWE